MTIIINQRSKDKIHTGPFKWRINALSVGPYVCSMVTLMFLISSTLHQHTASTHCIKTLHQHTASTHCINTLHQHTASTHRHCINTTHQHTAPTHNIDRSSHNLSLRKNFLIPFLYSVNHYRVITHSIFVSWLYIDQETQSNTLTWLPLHT